MEILPILSSLRRNKVGALLIALQIALTLAIVCNSLSIIQQRQARMHRPSGLDEANTFVFENFYIGPDSTVQPRIKADLAALRAMPGVVDAVASNSYPLKMGGWSSALALRPDQKVATVRTALYFADDHLARAWNLKLVAGRWFTADEIGQYHVNELKAPSVIIVTQSVANTLFPHGDALGKSVYEDGKFSVRIVGIVERAQTPWAANSWGESFIENSTFSPNQLVLFYLNFTVRAQPGQRNAVMRRVEDVLYGVSSDRVIEKLRTFADVRADIYRSDSALNVILTVVCALLLIVTAVGIVGLTTYWVAQRRRQIGVRRALGARRIDILRYFHTENFLIAGVGGVLGVALGLVGNLWLASNLELARMAPGFVIAAALIVLGLSQFAVLWPALRGASIPPALAARGA